jgi:hypothetical protein
MGQGMGLKAAAEALPAPGVLQDIQAAIDHVRQASGGKAGIAVSGAGAVAKNVILSQTKAFIDDGGEAAGAPVSSVVVSAGKVDIDAKSDSSIEAVVVAVSAAVGVGGTAGIGASVGFALARNFIGWDPSAAVASFTSDQEFKTIMPGMTVRVKDGVRGGDVYSFIGDQKNIYDFTSADGTQTLVNDSGTQTRVKVDDAIYVWQGDDDAVVNLATAFYDGVFVDGKWKANENWRLERASALSGEDFGDPDQWLLILPALIGDASQVAAFIGNSSVKAAGDLTLDAQARGSIDALTLAGSVAIAAGGTVGIGLSGAGVSVENRGRTVVKAFIDGDGDVVGKSDIEAANISLRALDNTRIKADAAAASIAASAAGTVGISLSIGISSAYNEIVNVVHAAIANADSVRAHGDITIKAETLGGDVPTPDHTTAAGVVTLQAGDTVRVADGYVGGGDPGRARGVGVADDQDAGRTARLGVVGGLSDHRASLSRQVRAIAEKMQRQPQREPRLANAT